VGPRAGQDAVKRRKISSHLLEFHGGSGRNLVSVPTELAQLLDTRQKEEKESGEVVRHATFVGGKKLYLQF
jgi:hypothetical protein